MARRIVWSYRANEQLKSILSYWQKRNGTKTYSKKLYKLFQQSLARLSRYPHLGRQSSNLTIKYIIVKDYYLYYSFDETELKVVALCDMRRNPNYMNSLIE